MFIIKKKSGALVIFKSVDAVFTENENEVNFKVWGAPQYTFKLKSESGESLENALIRGFSTNEIFVEV